MNIFICCSKHMYEKVLPIKQHLEQQGHSITLPNSFDDPGREARIQEQSSEQHAEFKSMMLKEQEKKINTNDAILVLNYEKKGRLNYIGGATFLEMFKAWELQKKIFLMNPVPDNILRDEILGMQPAVINQDLSLVR